MKENEKLIVQYRKRSLEVWFAQKTLKKGLFITKNVH